MTAVENLAKDPRNRLKMIETEAATDISVVGTDVLDGPNICTRTKRKKTDFIARTSCADDTSPSKLFSLKKSRKNERVHFYGFLLFVLS